MKQNKIIKIALLILLVITMISGYIAYYNIFLSTDTEHQPLIIKVSFITILIIVSGLAISALFFTEAMKIRKQLLELERENHSK